MLADPWLYDRRNQGQKTLIHEDRKGGKSRSYAHGSGENDGHEAVEHRLGVQDGVIPFRAGLERADDGHSSDAEQNRSVEESIGET